MGRKISVDSATMMNKGLEVIEAHWLFGVPRGAIEVVVHPQSVIHSLVEYVDGSVLAQLGHPDMRTPIAQALAFPERIDAGVAALDLARSRALDVRGARSSRAFPASRLAYDALRAGGTAPAVLNAANEVAVAAFLAGRASASPTSPRRARRRWRGCRRAPRRARSTTRSRPTPRRAARARELGSTARPFSVQ